MNGQCELFIYKNCKILKNKNFKVDDIQAYLSTLEPMNKVESGSPVAILGQWMKHQLKTKYIIEVKQTQLEGLSGSNRRRVQDLSSFEEQFNYNYLVAQNIDHYLVGTSQRVFRATKVYYFITGKRWMSENAIELELEMDVINTMIDNYNSGEEHLELSEKTTILREHKNRWSRVFNGVDVDYKPRIDRYGEGIVAPLYKTEEKTLGEQIYLGSYSFLNENFYLIFRARENPDEHPESPIDILLATDNVIYATGSSTGFYGSKDPVQDLGKNDYWVIYGADGNTGTSIDFTDKKGQQHIEITSSSQCLFINRNHIYKGQVGATGTTILEHYLPKAFARFRSVYFSAVQYVRVNNYGITPSDTAISQTTITTIGNMPRDTSFPTTSENIRLGTIQDIDRTDPRLLKIIKLPYRPFPTKWSIIASGDETYWGMSLPSNWGVLLGSGDFPTLIKYKSINFTDCFSSDYFYMETEDDRTYDPLHEIRQLYDETTDIKVGTIMPKDIQFETKLLHSDYYLRKFVYDSFVYEFRYENINIGKNKFGQFRVCFKVSSTMNSKMVFTFNQTEFVGLNGENGLVIDNQDYSNLLYIARNNELPLYNSAFLNYIRTGYNYDVKTKNRQLRNNIISGTITTIGAVASAVSSVATGPMGIAGAVALGTSAVSKFYQTASQNAQAEQNIAQKLKSTEMQGLSVIGSDDIDLMSDYTENNKAKDVKYEISPKMKECLFDLFYYCGYVANYQSIPKTNTRMWFNFVMAEPVYKNEQNFSQELVEELSKKYREGITFLHKVEVEENNETISRWDFEQEMENCETDFYSTPRLVYIDTPSSLKGKVEYVVRNNLDLDMPTALGRVSNTGKLTWRKRRKSDLTILEELTGLDTFVFNPDINTFKMDVRIGSTIQKEVSIPDYERADYYWTLEFSQDTSSGYQQENVYNIINAEIRFD